MRTIRTTPGRGVLWFIAFLAALVAIFATERAAGGAVAAAQDAIREIRIVGNKRVEPETVRSYLAFTIGDRYTEAKADQSFKALFGTGLFSDVKISRSAGGTVVVEVAEHPVVNRVAFEGNKDVDDATLAGEVQLKPRSVFTRARAQADVQRILDVYRRQGLFAARIEPKIIEQSNNRVDVVFEIVEGRKTTVKSISFIGNRAFSDGQLRDIITTTQTNFLSFLKPTNIYDPDRLNLDRELLRQYYMKNGYADMRVVSASADLDRDGSGFYITITIDEGELYNFGQVRIESTLSGVNPAPLQGDLFFKQGQLFNASLIEKTVEKLTLSVSEQGFAFARVRPRVDRDASSRTIAVSFLIDEGPRIYVERINIAGNTRTKDHVIRREFRVAEGDAFNPMLVDRAKKRLQALGFFKTVDVKREPGSAQDRVVLSVILVEQTTGELSFGAGYSTAEGVIGDISISERNLLGNGQFLRLKLAGSLERFQIDLSFTEPRFLDRNLAAGFDVFHKEVAGSQYQSFRSRTTGASVRLGIPIAENLWINTHYSFSHNNIFDVDLTRASRAILEAQGTSNTSLVGYVLTYDARNHPKSPNRGVYFALAQDFAGIGGDVQYHRTIVEGRGYYPITDKITFVARAIAGYIDGWGGEDVRLMDLFFRGGETVRGFDRAGFGPRDSLTGEALGGKAYYSATAEIRFPLPFVPDELGLGGAVFADAGSLFMPNDTTKRLNEKCGAGVDVNGRPLGVCLQDSDKIRASVGFSLLWNSPLGPLRGDFAYVLSKESYDDLQLFRFGASTKF